MDQHETTPFWIVWTPFGTNPQVQHRTRHDAEEEAKRLAQIVSGQEFYVLCPVFSAVKSNWIIRQFRSDE